MLFVNKRVTSAVKRVKFVSDRMSYIQLRGSRCSIIVQNAHTSFEYKSDDSADSFSEELEQVLGHFCK